ncbi:hypothetical protein NX059_004770 [Plenodomus lindquistii]|nr:hypothetical protein NX059_004770 [Plenodomus lindquistii]
MCKYTVYNYDCGHKAEDHVDSSLCSEFQRTGVHCDRDNPANRGRVKIKTKGRNGICGPCLRPRRETAEAFAENDLNKVREIIMAEAKAHEEHMQRAEQRAREESLAQAAERERAQDARIAELERQSAEEFARKLQEQEDADFEYMLRQSREEAEQAARQQEMEEMEALQRAFRESLELNQPQREYQDKVTRKWTGDLGGGQMLECTSTATTSRTTSKRKETAIPNPDLSTYLSQPVTSIAPPPPPPPPASIPRAPTLPPMQKPVSRPMNSKPVDYSLSAIGPQNIGRFKVGTRSQPIHPSQELHESEKTKSPISPTNPAPFARLGSQLAPDSPATRPAQGPGVQVTSSINPRSGLRHTSEPRPSFQLPEEPQIDAQLQALLAKRRKWELEEDSDRTGGVP